MADTAIEWADAVWNVLAGCSRVSAGCQACYAERLAHRLAAMGQKKYAGLTKKVGDEVRWTGEVRFVEEALALPLRWKAPRRIFVNSMSDLFHEKVSNEHIAAIFGVMAAASRHTFQVLTKRPERMRTWFDWLGSTGEEPEEVIACQAARVLYPSDESGHITFEHHSAETWPLPNVWLGVSVEDQATADARIPLLLQTPAAVRWVSYEPALGPVSFIDHDWTTKDYLRGMETLQGHERALPGKLDWIVVGGESGPGARPFDLAWARQTIAQARATGVATFFKQAGSHPILDGQPLKLKDRKGGDLSELPDEFHVREYPDAAA